MFSSNPFSCTAFTTPIITFPNSIPCQAAHSILVNLSAKTIDWKDYQWTSNQLIHRYIVIFSSESAKIDWPKIATVLTYAVITVRQLAVQTGGIPTQHHIKLKTFCSNWMAVTYCTISWSEVALYINKLCTCWKRQISTSLIYRNLFLSK